MDDYKLFDAEYRLMDLVWTEEPVNSTALSRMCLEGFGWKKPTTYTVIRRLAQRGVLKTENAVVTSLVSREEVREAESREFLEKNFGGSLPGFIAAFARRQALTPEEAAEIRRMIDAYAPPETGGERKG